MSEPTDFPIKPDRLDIYTAHMAYPVYIDGVPLAALIEARAERDALIAAQRDLYGIADIKGRTIIVEGDSRMKWPPLGPNATAEDIANRAAVMAGVPPVFAGPYDGGTPEHAAYLQGLGEGSESDFHAGVILAEEKISDWLVANGFRDAAIAIDASDATDALTYQADNHSAPVVD